MCNSIYGNRLFSNFILCIYILTKSEFISSCSQPPVGSNIAQITRATFCVHFFKMAAGSHFGCPKITLYRFSCHFRSIPQFVFLWIFFTKWLPFWMSQDHFLSHFWQFQINTKLYILYFLQNGRRILDVRNSLLIAFLAIWDQYATLIFFNFFTKWLPSAILDVRNSLWITFLAILDKYRILCWICLQNGCHRPFWMTENHFRSHFWPFQINTKLFVLELFYKMAAGAHFGCPKFTFDLISGHFRSICNFNFWFITSSLSLTCDVIKICVNITSLPVELLAYKHD